MQKKRHSPKHLIAKLRAVEVDLATGIPIEQFCTQLEVSAATFHRWRAQFGGMKADEMKRLKALEKENTRLKKMMADQALDLSILKEVARENF